MVTPAIRNVKYVLTLLEARERRDAVKLESNPRVLLWMALDELQPVVWCLCVGAWCFSPHLLLVLFCTHLEPGW
jgi:hypothetical protein